MSKYGSVENFRSVKPVFYGNAPGNNEAEDVVGSGTVTSVGSGTGLTGGPITVSGSLALADTAVAPASYGTATQVPQIAVDQQGRITSASNVAISVPSAITIQDEGAPLATAADTLDFVGAGVTATGAGSTKTITIPGAAGGVTVQDEGAPLATVADTLDFVGAGVTATGAGTTKTITIPGGGGGVTVEDEGVPLVTIADTLDFVGAGVTASGAAGTKTITIPGGISGVTVEDEGAPLATAATTLDFVGAGVTATGAGATKTITIPGAAAATVEVAKQAGSTTASSPAVNTISPVQVNAPTAHSWIVAGGASHEWTITATGIYTAYLAVDTAIVGGVAPVQGLATIEIIRNAGGNEFDNDRRYVNNTQALWRNHCAIPFSLTAGQTPCTVRFTAEIKSAGGGLATISASSRGYVIKHA